jgi:threonine/homoserine/homoserine lactone efflux protein
MLVGASNPKALFFFGALFPQFIDPSAPQLSQFLVLGITFIFFELFWLSIYAITAARARRWLQKPRRARLFNRVTGAVSLVAAGLLATTQRNPASGIALERAKLRTTPCRSQRLMALQPS